MRSGREQEIDHLSAAPASARARKKSRATPACRLRATPTSRGAPARLLAISRTTSTSLIGRPGYVGVTARSGDGSCRPTNILDARQRWLFRMVHTERPLQEKMALFWHNHFATAYTQDRRRRSARPTATRDDGGQAVARIPAGVKGQIELFREHALGNFRDLLVAVAKDPAMLVWLDGRTNVRARPQENFARELMELFTWASATSPRPTSTPARGCSPAGT